MQKQSDRQNTSSKNNCCSCNYGKVSAGFKDAQKRVDDWCQQHKDPYWPALSNMARLSEEVGEVARILNHLHGSKPKKQNENEQDLGEELADVMFTVICLANDHKIDLDVAFDRVMEKCNGRDKDRFEKK